MGARAPGIRPKLGAGVIGVVIAHELLEVVHDLVGFLGEVGAEPQRYLPQGGRVGFPHESVTVTTTESVPAVVGVPEITPAAHVSPAGSPVAVHEYGGTPPVAARDAE